ncbi:MAG: FAD-dependent thymidylate synthase [Actinomycetota bacterium]
MSLWFSREEFSDSERALLSRYFSNLDLPVFALINMPEVVKGALFARYSRTPKSLRRLFLDEFAEQVASGKAPEPTMGEERAEKLFDRVFVEYGDDSVAQLGGVHLACEQASQLLCKQLEWGRLAAYLEQSTRYMRYDDKPGGRWRVTMPPELEGTPHAASFSAFVDLALETYGRLFEPMQQWYRERFPQEATDSDFVYRSTIQAKTCDTLRGLLPAATRSNLGIYATGQAYEQLLLRLRAHPLQEMREYGDLMLTELRTVIPAFLKRVDVEDRGVAWSRYLADRREATQEIAAKFLEGVEVADREEVTLVDSDPDGEVKVVAAALYASSELPDDRLHELARSMTVDERSAVLTAYVGERSNRRHKPGRAFERTGYRFDVLCDYGAFRDLQRHRLLTVEWQHLTTTHGYELPADIERAGFSGDAREVLERSANLERELRAAGFGDAAQYAVSLQYRIRFVLQMNAREAMHLAELRSAPQGHPVYRRVAQRIHELIADQAGHRAIAAAMQHVDHSDVDLERLDAERRTEAKRRAVADS